MARMIRTIITIPEDEKQWLESYGLRCRISSAEVVRRAIGEYRRTRSGKGLAGVLRDTAGSWTSIKGDSQDHIDALRKEWEQRK